MLGGSGARPARRRVPARRGASQHLGAPRGRGVGWFGLAGLINAAGTGFYYPFALLFFQQRLHVSLTLVGTGLTVAALVALPAMPAAGRAVDRYGPKTVLIVSALARALAFAGFLVSDQYRVFLVLSVVVALCARTEQVGTPTLAAALAPAGQAGRWLGLSRLVFNAGFGVGALLAGVTVGLAGHGFAVLGLINALSFVGAALCYLPLAPARQPARSRDVASRRPWRTPSFLAVVGASSLLWTIALGVETALPVFVVRQLTLPSWTVGALFAINTGLLTALQLPVSGWLERFAPRLLVGAGSALHAGLLVALLAAGRISPVAQLLVLVSGMVLYTLGELIATQSILVLLTAHSPVTERGSFLAFHQILIGAAGALVPLGVTLLLDHAPTKLWWLLLLVALTLAGATVLPGRRPVTLSLTEGIRP